MATTVLHTTVLDSLGRRITSGDVPVGTPLTLESRGAEVGGSRPVARAGRAPLRWGFGFRLCPVLVWGGCG